MAEKRPLDILTDPQKKALIAHCDFIGELALDGLLNSKDAKELIMRHARDLVRERGVSKSIAWPVAMRS